ncbi:universal stress protein [Archaeoglobus neptunius]|uniref:universal stress protein n=1 Tax=Archaeoglobus neptunius TaxID=2798580 RepID=UPI00192666E1|nr:universal stress protein [Archaeoglobus neptunius]
MQKILLILDDTERGKTAFKKLLELAEDGLRGEVSILYIREMEIPPFVSEEKELSSYHRLISHTMEKLEKYKQELENAGFTVSDVKVSFGKYADRVLILEKEMHPDLIVVGMKRSISGLFRKDPCEVLLKRSRSNLLICRD